MAWNSSHGAVVGEATKKSTPDKLLENNKINRDNIRGDNVEGTGTVGHTHTGAGANDGLQIPTAGIADNAVTSAKLNAAVAGAGITGGGGAALALAPDNVTVELAGDTLRVKDAGISQAKLKTTSATVNSGTQVGPGITNANASVNSGEYALGPVWYWDGTGGNGNNTAGLFYNHSYGGVAIPFQAGNAAFMLGLSAENVGAGGTTVTVYATTRWIQASLQAPVYFFRRNKITGKIGQAAYLNDPTGDLPPISGDADEEIFCLEIYRNAELLNHIRADTRSPDQNSKYGMQAIMLGFYMGVITPDYNSVIEPLLNQNNVGCLHHPDVKVIEFSFDTSKALRNMDEWQADPTYQKWDSDWYSVYEKMLVGTLNG
jgi:hypothetical protein